MQMPSQPFTRDLVLIGGGHTHALVLRRWAMNPLPGARLTLIDPSPVAAYSGMLPGFVAGHYRQDELEIDLLRLTRAAGARLIVAPAEGLDVTGGYVHVQGRPPVGFDIASIDIGITSAMPALPGFAEHGVSAKPLGRFAETWAAFRDSAPDGARVVVIGGGIAGAELALCAAHALKGRAPQITVVDSGPALTLLRARPAAMMRAELARAGVALIEQVAVSALEAGRVLLADGRALDCDLPIGAAGASPHAFNAASGLALHDGFIAVDAQLQTSGETVFAAGDCAHLTSDPRPKAGVFAVRQAPVLLHNLRARLMGRGDLHRYRPQKDHLKLVSLGGRRALAAKWGFAATGAPLWTWKEWIDRRFMAMLSALPQMTEAPPIERAAGDETLGKAMLCGGCGAKVGRDGLHAALAALPPPRDGSGLARPEGDDAAMLTIGGAELVLTTDHLRALTPDPWLMGRIAATHALGDVWAMGAEPLVALLGLTLPRMSPALQARTLAELMDGISGVIDAAGAEIGGGHTSMGAELSVALSLTGRVSSGATRLAGGQAGDALILTKPLGSGVILAAEMAGKAPARVVLACYETMLQSQRQPAALLASAHAMTDVTGFGLAGHLAGMAQAAGLGAEIELAAVPAMAGALELDQAGHRASIWQENRASAGVVPGAEGSRAALLFDPQTCGGLLAALPQAEADPVLARLHQAGIPAARIGKLLASEGIICR